MPRGGKPQTGPGREKESGTVSGGEEGTLEGELEEATRKKSETRASEDRGKKTRR